jgi:hypothetical protein
MITLYLRSCNSIVRDVAGLRPGMYVRVCFRTFCRSSDHRLCFTNEHTCMLSTSITCANAQVRSNPIIASGSRSHSIDVYVSISDQRHICIITCAATCALQLATHGMYISISISTWRSYQNIGSWHGTLVSNCDCIAAQRRRQCNMISPTSSSIPNVFSFSPSHLFACKYSYPRLISP